MSDHEPNTALNLGLCNNELDLELILDRSSLKSSSLSLPLLPLLNNPSEPRIFSCNFCRRKFYNSRALGGHQNAHKLERTLAKKSLELSSAIRPHVVSNRQSSGSNASRGKDSNIGIDQHHRGYGQHGSEMSSGRRKQAESFESRMGIFNPCSNDQGGYSSENVQEDSGKIDLTLRL